MITLVPSSTYSNHVVRAINTATKHVYVLALIVQQGDDAEQIITSLVRAAHRGVKVHVMADFSTYSYLKSHLWPSSVYARHSRYVTDMESRLKAAGVTFVWLGTHGSFLFAGRTHSKWIVIDDLVFSFGGINLHAAYRSDRDFMLMSHESDMADVLMSEHESIAHTDKHGGAAYLSHTSPCGIGTILFDGGIPGDSIIYRRAAELCRDAKSIIMTTQYCPTGKLAGYIKNTEHRIYFNNSTSSSDFFTRQLIAFGERITGIKNSYTGSEYIHAKYMIVTHHDGSKTAITGSHNFISYGGLLGTREVALETKDPRVITALETFTKQYIV